LAKEQMKDVERTLSFVNLLEVEAGG